MPSATVQNRPEVLVGAPVVRSGVTDAERIGVVDRLQLPGHADDLELQAVVDALAAGTGAPVAVVNLVRPGLQTYPVEIGVGAPCTHVPDHLSFCAEVVDTNLPLVVPDAHLHPTYCANPLVRRGAIRSYAGVPLLHAGAVVGSVSVFDPRPRAFGAEDLRLLTSLARLATAVLALRSTSSLDALTGLPNRDRATELAQSSLVDGDVGVLLVALDEFKRVNDLHGHSVGDVALVAAVGELSSRLRPHGGVLARWGGDEFVVLLPGADRGDVALAAADLAAPMRRLSSAEVSVTVTVGTTVGRCGEDGGDVVHRAGAAARAGKRAGKNRVVPCTDRVLADERGRLETSRALRLGLDRGELTLHYQPTWTASGELCGLEALARWEHDGEPVPPSLFVPVAEESGLVLELGEQVLELACRQVAQWRRTYPAARGVRTWVNVSPRQLEQHGFVLQVASSLRRHGLEPDGLGIEVTETAAALDGASALRNLEKVRRLGVAVALDDFGTGQSSLGRLRALPVDVLKLDRSFVTGLSLEQPQRLAFVRAVVELGHTLGLRVVAEGVEVDPERQALLAIGCDALQGYLLGRPAPAEDVAALLSR